MLCAWGFHVAQELTIPQRLACQAPHPGLSSAPLLTPSSLLASPSQISAGEHQALSDSSGLPLPPTPTKSSRR